MSVALGDMFFLVMDGPCALAARCCFIEEFCGVPAFYREGEVFLPGVQLRQVSNESSKTNAAILWMLIGNEYIRSIYGSAIAETVHEDACETVWTYKEVG